jgi:hypothetical protein
VCLAKAAARVGERLRAGRSPPRSDVIGVIRQPDELDCSSGVSEGNGDVDVVCIFALAGPKAVPRRFTSVPTRNLRFLAGGYMHVSGR